MRHLIMMYFVGPAGCDWCKLQITDGILMWRIICLITFSAWNGRKKIFKHVSQRAGISLKMLKAWFGKRCVFLGHVIQPSVRPSIHHRVSVWPRERTVMSPFDAIEMWLTCSKQMESGTFVEKISQANMWWDQDWNNQHREHVMFHHLGSFEVGNVTFDSSTLAELVRSSAGCLWWQVYVGLKWLADPWHPTS